MKDVRFGIFLICTSILIGYYTVQKYGCNVLPKSEAELLQIIVQIIIFLVGIVFLFKAFCNKK